MKVRDLMAQHVITVNPDMPVREAARILTEHGIAYAPVVVNHAVIGAVEAHDLPRSSETAAREVDETSRGRASDTRTRLTVGDVMWRGDVPRLAPDEEVGDASARLARAHARRGVVFHNGRLVGLLSTTDIALRE